MNFFKSLSLTLAFLVLTTAGFAQSIDRTKAPEPGPAPKINIGDAETFTLKNGLKVYVVENRKLPTLSVSLSLFRDPMLEGDKAGMLSMYGQVMQAGTKNMSKEELDEAVDFIGASLNASATGMYGYSLTRHQEKLMDLMTDVLYNPLFPEAELEKAKKQQISGLASSKEDPNAISAKIVDALLYGADHPYGEQITEETASNVTIDDIKEYYNTFYKPNIASLVLVGNIDVKEAKKLANKYFSKWEKGDVPSMTYDDPKPTTKTGVALMNRESSVQSVINVTHTIPLKTGDEDQITVSVLNNILGGSSSSRLFRNLREDKGYTYGAYSNFSAQRLIGSFSASASVRNAVTDSAVTEFMNELMTIRTEDVSDEEINNAKASLTGSFARSLESPQTVANFALNIDRYDLPKDYYANYLKKLNSVSKSDVKAAANKYIHPDKANIVVVGNAKEIAAGLAQFGEIQYFDADGNPTEAPKAAESADMSAEDIFAKFVEAVGGEEVVKAKTDIKMVGNATVQERPIELVMVYGEPKQFSMTMNMMGMTMSEQMVNGDTFTVKQGGQSAPLRDSDKQQLMRDAYLVPELFMDQIGGKAEVTGIEDVDGKRAYVVKITDDAGTYTNYYDADTFLRIRKVSTTETPQGAITQTISYGNWKDYDGLKVPTLMIQDLGQIKLEINFNTIEINSGAVSVFE
jgi:predicted Zn-dependent peptidase